jgi:hypothetical protein
MRSQEGGCDAAVEMTCGLPGHREATRPLPNVTLPARSGNTNPTDSCFGEGSPHSASLKCSRSDRCECSTIVGVNFQAHEYDCGCTNCEQMQRLTA